MQTFEYQISEKKAGPDTHSWVAEEVGTDCGSIALPDGGIERGNRNQVGKYPEIEAHLRDKHSINAPLIYLPELDELTIDQNGNSVWTFHRQAADIIVKDIPRVIFSVSTRS